MLEKKTYLVAAMLLIGLAASVGVAQAADGPCGIIDEFQAMPAPAPGPTHEVVCKCDCDGATQTFAWNKDAGCSGYEGIECDDDGNELSNCKAKTQEIPVLFTPILPPTS